VGSEVTEVEVGQQVATTAGRAGPDVESAWGTHASWLVADVSDVYDATGISPVRASFLVSGQVGFNAASRLVLPADSRVAVIGDGIIGASAALACAARGFSVLVVGRHADRLASLAQLGLRIAAAADGDAPLREHETVAVVDTAQNEAAFASYINVLPRCTGQLVYSGHSPGGVTCWGDMAALQKQEITVHFVSGMLPHRLRATLDLMRDGRLPLDRLASRIAKDEVATRMLLDDVAAGNVAPVAVAVDWRWAG
jgi:threonine dehydrogenase-like Zn-dependent dehydrogenase